MQKKRKNERKGKKRKQGKKKKKRKSWLREKGDPPPPFAPCPPAAYGTHNSLWRIEGKLPTNLIASLIAFVN